MIPNHHRDTAFLSSSKSLIRCTCFSWRYFYHADTRVCPRRFDVVSSLYIMYVHLTLVSQQNVKTNNVCHSAKKMRWCTVSEPERRKCADLAKALGAAFPTAATLYSQLSCVRTFSTADCLSKIRVSYCYLHEILMYLHLDFILNYFLVSKFTVFFWVQ